MRAALVSLFALAALFVTPAAIAVPPVLTGMPEDATLEATSPAGATHSWTDPTAVSGNNPLDPVPVVCSPPSGTTFPLGVTTVTCTATDPNTDEQTSDTFDVTVQDTTPPSLTVPGNMTVAATGPGGAVVSFSASASDSVDPSVSVGCSPPSGSTFPLGATTVTCTATDDSGNTDEDSFTVTVEDTTPPTVIVPGNITAEATGPGGATVSFSVTASDLVDPTPTISCSPPSGSTFPIATTSVNCSATDDSGNQSATQSFNVVVRDTTPPSVSVPGDIVAEATGPAGAIVTFSASASDIVDGSVAPNCAPGSGSTFPITSTTVTCTATDARGNSRSATFRVLVRDTTGPVVDPVPEAGITAEADGPTGSRVTYVPPSAIDAVSGPVPVDCSPGPGALFPLGVTTVTCSATDAKGNGGSVSFPVQVVDTTKPALNAPPPQDVSSRGASTLSKSDPQVVEFLGAAVARDLVSGMVPVTNNAPDVLPLGTTRVTFTATDASGNRATDQSELTVVTRAVAPQVRDLTPPSNVSKLKAVPGDRSIELTWVPPKTDFSYVAIARSPGRGNAPSTVVYKGSAKRLKDANLTNGVEYRYLATSYDKARNFSAGTVVRATPKRPLLYAPAAGFVVTKPPLLRWVAVSGAAYYNVQLYRGRSPVPRAKIFSAWPARPQLALGRTWKFGGKKQQLTPGVYIWFAWPGIGTKAANRYGPLIGQSSFVVAGSP